jgi:hypothetical protein
MSRNVARPQPWSKWLTATSRNDLMRAGGGPMNRSWLRLDTGVPAVEDPLSNTAAMPSRSCVQGVFSGTTPGSASTRRLHSIVVSLRRATSMSFSMTPAPSSQTTSIAGLPSATACR